MAWHFLKLHVCLGWLLPPYFCNYGVPLTELRSSLCHGVELTEVWRESRSLLVVRAIVTSSEFCGFFFEVKLWSDVQEGSRPSCPDVYPIMPQLMSGVCSARMFFFRGHGSGEADTSARGLYSCLSDVFSRSSFVSKEFEWSERHSEHTGAHGFVCRMRTSRL